MKQKTFLLVGMGGRNLPTFAKGLLGWPEKGWPEFPEKSRIVGLMDTNIERARACKDELEKRPIPYELPLFANLNEALSKTRPDWCVVCVPDRTHLEVCLQCIEGGSNLIVEKPLATSLEECRKIIAAAKKAGREVLVAHNYRYMNFARTAEKIVREGKIGKVLSWRAGEILGNAHGGDYFHRWHSDFAMSAGMLNHKGCHHFDLLFWIIKDKPVCASAMGSRVYYKERSDIAHARRCCECKLKRTCPHTIDMDIWDGIYRKMYKDAESVDGYIRDKCVFSDRHSIYDNYTVNMQLESGVIGNYVLTTFGPREQCYFEICGTEASLEAGSDTLNGGEYVRIIKQKSYNPESMYMDGATIEKIEFGDEGGMHGHGGADVRMVASLLGLTDDFAMATAEEAALAVGAADIANRSLAAGGVPVWMKDAGKDYPKAPPQPAWA